MECLVSADGAAIVYENNSCRAAEFLQKKPPARRLGVDDRVIRGEGEGKCRFEADGLLHVLQGVVAFLAGADLDDVLHIVHKDLAVADMAGV